MVHTLHCPHEDFVETHEVRGYAEGARVEVTLMVQAVCNGLLCGTRQAENHELVRLGDRIY